MPKYNLTEEDMNATDNTDYKFLTQFDRLNKYEDMDEIRKKFPTAAAFNQKFNTDDIDFSSFFILRSTNDENIHKAIKYGVWTSSP